MPDIKLVVWDLDNTLWDGSVFYRDKDAIKIKPGTAAALKELGKRSIANAVCSKNNYEDADKKLEDFGIKKYFQEFEIGWGLKSDAIKRLMQKFHAQPEETLFIDDDPFQRAEVENAIAGINTVSLADPLDILSIEGVQPLDQTNVDRQRVIILKQQRDREEAEKTHAGNYKGFLKECGIEMEVHFAEDSEMPRAVQLLNRTNELNATANRYTFEEMSKLRQEGAVQILVATLKDKFGDYGLIAESVLEPRGDELFIRDIAVSCRTMGRGIGGAMATAILNYAKSQGIPKVVGYVQRNESNWRMTPLFEKRNFQKLKEEQNRTYYQFLTKEYQVPEFPGHLKVDHKF